MSELSVQSMRLRLPGSPSAPVFSADGPLDRVMVCRDPVTGKAVERPPGHTALNLDGQHRCSLPLPRPGSEALTRSPSASDRNGITGWVAAQVAARSDTPFAGIKKRLFASYGGVDNLMRVLAPGELDSYRLLLGKTLDARDEATLKVCEEQLRSLKARFLGEARGVLARERQRLQSAGEPFDALEVLKSKGLVWPGWERPRPGQAALMSVPADDWRDERSGLYSQRVPIEAELILNTAMPIGVGSEKGIVFLRGESFGVDRSITPAANELAQRKAQAERASVARIENATAAAGLGSAEASVTAREEAARRAFKVTEATLAATTESVVQTARAVEDAQKRAAAAVSSERVPITQLEADLELMVGTDLVINFRPGFAEILADSRPALDGLVKRLQSKNVVDLQVTIEGHTDGRGKPAKNQELSERRASAVRRYLIAAGIDGARLDALGMGSRAPIPGTDPNDDRNRRVRVSVEIPPERQNEMRARLATAQEAYASSMEAHQRAVTEALEAATAAATSHETALASRKQVRETAIDAITARVAASNAFRKAQRASAKTDTVDRRAQEELEVAERYDANARSNAQGFFVINYVDNENILDRTPPQQLGAKVTQALLSPEAEQSAGELFSRCNGSECKKLAAVVGEIVAQQQAKKSSGRANAERLRILWAQMVGDRSVPIGRFVTVAGSFGPHDKKASPYIHAAIPLPERLTTAQETSVPVEVVVDSPQDVRKNEPPRDPQHDAELAIEDTPSSGDTEPPPDKVQAAAAQSLDNDTPIEESELWAEWLPAMRVGSPLPPVAKKLEPSPVRIVVVAGPRNSQEPPDEQVVLDKDLRDEPLPQALPDAAALQAELDAAKARSEEAERRAAEALAAAKAARDRAGQGAAIPSSVSRRGGSTSVRLDIRFTHDSAVIADATALEALVPKLRSDEFRGRRILIAGHTDKTGSDEHNQRLSLRRAQAVRDHLNARGVPAEVLVVQGFGAKHLIPGTDPNDPANRRVVISVIELSK